MLRVGLTGGLGSGKSTVAAMLREHGARTLSADEIARDLMHPGQPVYAAIVDTFGDRVVQPSGHLDRGELARIAFTEGRAEDLNAIVHPAVIARQAEIAGRLFAEDPFAVVVVESALLFETRHAGPGGWRDRFDCVVLVTAPEDIRVQRYVDRMAPLPQQRALRQKLAADACDRIAHQLSDTEKIAGSDFVLENGGTLPTLQAQVDSLWLALQVRAQRRSAQRPG